MNECDKERQQEWWPGHVAKGCLMVSLDNEVHVSSLNVIQRREVTMQSCVSIPTSTFLLQQADWKGAGHGVLHVDWPLGGEPALKKKKLYMCMIVYVLLCSWSANFQKTEQEIQLNQRRVEFQTQTRRKMWEVAWRRQRWEMKSMSSWIENI